VPKTPSNDCRGSIASWLNAAPNRSAIQLKIALTVLSREEYNSHIQLLTIYTHLITQYSFKLGRPASFTIIANDAVSFGTPPKPPGVMFRSASGPAINVIHSCVRGFRSHGTS
jgi:hypothetical protein